MNTQTKALLNLHDIIETYGTGYNVGIMNLKDYNKIYKFVDNISDFTNLKDFILYNWAYMLDILVFIDYLKKFNKDNLFKDYSNFLTELNRKLINMLNDLYINLYDYLKDNNMLELKGF